jgi:hypothetical protein
LAYTPGGAFAIVARLAFGSRMLAWPGLIGILSRMLSVAFSPFMKKIGDAMHRRIAHTCCWNAVEELQFMISKILPTENVPEWRTGAYEVVWDAIREYLETLAREEQRIRPLR